MNDTQLIEWKEPIVFMRPNNEGEMIAKYSTKRRLPLKWYQAELTQLPKRFMKHSSFLMILAIIGYLLVAGRATIGGILGIIGAATLRVFVHCIPEEIQGLTDVNPAHVKITKRGIFVESEGEKLNWRYDEIVRVRVGAKRYRDVELKQLRLKIRATGWYPLMIAEEVDIAELVDVLRNQGVKVSGPTKQLETGLAA